MPFGNFSGSASVAAAVTKSDSTVVGFRALYVGGAGDVAVYMADNTTDTSVVFAGVPAGSILPIAVRRVLSTGTTATLIIGLI